jgi:hypothetical protein
MANDTSIGSQELRTISASAAAAAETIPPETLAITIQPRVDMWGGDCTSSAPRALLQISQTAAAMRSVARSLR